MPQMPSPHAPYRSAPSERLAFRQSHTWISPAAHWLKTAGILSPLLIHEFVKDPEQRWRYTRIALVATAALAQGLYAQRIHREREARRGQQSQR
jgi:hypothetical protein